MNNLLSQKSETRSKPTAGKTMLGLLKAYGPNLLQAHTMLVNELRLFQSSTLKHDWFTKVLLFRCFENNKAIVNDNKFSLISLSLIMNWICGRILNQVSINADILDAEMWFQKSSKIECISQNISVQTNKLITNFLGKIDVHTMLETIPYLAEVFETGNETTEEKGVKRKKKKNYGIYYTPTDIIDFIVTRSISNRSGLNSSIENLKWYDPALGTGSFLLSVLNYYSTTNKNINNEELIHYCKNNLIGTDISPHALQSAAYILATNSLVNSNSGEFKKSAKIIGSNLVLTDATTIDSKEKLINIFPEIGMSGVDFIISNPPYSKKRQQQLNLFMKNENIQTNLSNEIYPDFIKILLDLTSKNNGGGGMVVPLSLVASSKNIFKKLRSYIQSKNGSIEFWNFDRTPDSLFGDDVKTRNTIFFFNNDKTLKSGEEINSSYLHRWNSRNRDKLFTSMTLVNLKGETDIINGVPKVGDEFGLKLLNQINSKPFGHLAELLKKAINRTDLITKPTAYNWLPLALRMKNNTSNKSGQIFWEINSDKVSAPVVYAILNSRITYWLWRIWGDGFHLTTQFINKLPYGQQFFNEIDHQLAEDLGLRLWNKAKRELRINRNAGIISYTYCPLNFPTLLDEIDALIITLYELPDATNDYIKNNINQLIVAGRENESINKIKYLNL